MTVNGKSLAQSLPEGLGLHNTDPAHLAFSATAVFEIPAQLLKSGLNTMEIRVKNDGWFTWDAVLLASERE